MAAPELFKVDQTLARTLKGLKDTFGMMENLDMWLKNRKGRVALGYFELLTTTLVTLFPPIILTLAGFIKSALLYVAVS